MKVHIIGGGVIGLCSAWYLHLAGFDVTMIDEGDLSKGTSHGNSGLIVPSHFTPLAAPGIISKGLKWMLDSKSPFYINFHWSISLIRWLWLFYRAASDRKKVDQAMLLLLEYNLWSRSLYEELEKDLGIDFHFEKKGLLMLFKTEKTAKEEKKTAERSQEIGLEAHYLSAAEVQSLENTPIDVYGGVYYPQDAQICPDIFMRQLRDLLEEKGVQFFAKTQLQDFDISNGEIKKLKFSNGKSMEVQKVLLCSGAWSGQIAKKLKTSLPLQSGKGYSITYKGLVSRPQIPSILCEPKVAVTPMGNDLRLGGTLELANFSPEKNVSRVQGIIDGFASYYPALKVDMPKVEAIWTGYRPCSPDGLPYIGFSHKISNLCFATGHAMMGLSLGPATGKLISEIFRDQKTTIPTELFSPNRY